jgi:carbon storage regulator
MLVLSRRLGESVIVGDNITVTVLGVKGHRVQIGISAPKDIPVRRVEIERKGPREAVEASSAIPL